MYVALSKESLLLDLSFEEMAPITSLSQGVSRLLSGRRKILAENNPLLTSQPQWTHPGRISDNSCSVNVFLDSEVAKRTIRTVWN